MVVAGARDRLGATAGESIDVGWTSSLSFGRRSRYRRASPPLDTICYAPKSSATLKGAVHCRKMESDLTPKFAPFFGMVMSNTLPIHHIR